MFLSSYQISCAVLVALGRAEETQWGAIPRPSLRLPLVLPRWDDVCVVVLSLAEQQNMLGYRLRDGSVPPAGKGAFVVGAMDAPPPPEPNIAAAHGLGPARAAPEVATLFETLNIVSHGRWTEAAETVLWRLQPMSWHLDVVSDPRFIDAVDQALATMPQSVCATMDRLVLISEEDIAAVIESSILSGNELRERYGADARIGQPLSAERAQKSVEFLRRNELDCLFFRRWRPGNGWLSFHEMGQAVKIFHDRLAIAMLRAVTMKRYPGIPFLES